VTQRRKVSLHFQSLAELPLLDAGVTMQHERFEDSDHGLTHNLPVDVARKAFDLISAHLSRAFSR
jgi:hypothetical protein